MTMLKRDEPKGIRIHHSMSSARWALRAAHVPTLAPEALTARRC
jgi:hypothetical protein